MCDAGPLSSIAWANFLASGWFEQLAHSCYLSKSAKGVDNYLFMPFLTHWGQVTLKCISNLCPLLLSFLLLFFPLAHCYFLSCHFIHTASATQMNCYFLSCYFFSYLPTVTFFPVTLFILLPKWTVTFFPVTFFPTCPLLLSFLLLYSYSYPKELLLSFLLLFFLLAHCYFLSCYFFSYLSTVTFFPVTFFPVTFFPTWNCYFLSCYLFSCYFLSVHRNCKGAVTCAVCPESAWLVTNFWLVTFQQEWSHGVHCGAVRPANQAKKLPQPRCQKLPQRPLRLKRDSPNTR